VDADARFETQRLGAGRVRFSDVVEFGEKFERRCDAACGVVFVRFGKAEIDEQAVAQELRDVTAVFCEDAFAGLLVG
jgi:hypothetical protein